jgi:hypothetical protein
VEKIINIRFSVDGGKVECRNEKRRERDNKNKDQHIDSKN